MESLNIIIIIIRFCVTADLHVLKSFFAIYITYMYTFICRGVAREERSEWTAQATLITINK